MRGVARTGPVACLALAAALISLSGCTSAGDYFRNGFKVGPNYQKPSAPVAEHWIDAADVRVRSQTDDISAWWTVFNDPTLNDLINTAYGQNLTLREAGFRVLEARAQLGIARGELWPQTQQATGSYTHGQVSLNPPKGGPLAGGRAFDQWSTGFNLNWELDFWGRFRRAIASADATLDASVEGYDDALVTLLADVATNYVQIRTDQERIKLLEANAELQREVLKFVEKRFKAGVKATTELDVEQAKSNLAQTVAQLPPLLIDLRTANNQLCILMGMPPEDLKKRIGNGPISVAPVSVAVGIPADLLRRRPDVRRAERIAAAQAEQIGIAESALYPAISVNGTFGWQASQLSHLFTPQAFNGSVGPSFQWNLLNYGRIVNNTRLQDATFQEFVATYQQTVLSAAGDVENGLVNFLQAQERTKLLDESVKDNKIARDVAFAQYDKGLAGSDFNRYATIEQTLIQQQDLWAQARGQIAQGLISVYRALGGGWQIRLGPESREDDAAPAVEAAPTVDAAPPVDAAPAVDAVPPATPENPEVVPAPQLNPEPAPEPPPIPKAGPAPPVHAAVAVS